MSNNLIVKYIYIYIFSVSKFLFLLKNITMRKCLIIVLKDCYFHEVETVLALMNVFAYVKCFNGHTNLIQIQPGVKAKLSLILFYSFLKQNIKSCNAIETVKTTRMIKTTTTTTTIGPISKKQKTLQVQQLVSLDQIFVNFTTTT